jgi:glutamyl/glutaminyl-tRNA synthetase
MTYLERFTDAELEKIIDAGLVYMCACPAQVAEAIRKLRQLHRYQINCLDDPTNCNIVHQTIARHTAITHAQMQDCLDEVLVLEEWDRTTLEMPKGLRVRLNKEMLKD